MSGPGRGRGRGRVPKPGDMKEPDTAALDKIKQEKASINKTSSLPTSEQTADPLDEIPDTAKTTTGMGKPPPIAQELKEVRIEVGQTSSISVDVIPIPNKLNQSAVPLVSGLNPCTPEFTPTTISSPPFTKHSITTNAISSLNQTTSNLNPNSKEFVPSSKPIISNGDLSMYGNGDVMEGEEQGYLDVKDIVRGFERAAPTEVDDHSAEIVLKAGAEMLLKVLNYPGSFSEIAKMFKETLKNWPPSEATLANLAEMLISWGVSVPDLRYPACRICHLLSETDIGESFIRQLVPRLRSWHCKYSLPSLNFSSDYEMFDFGNYCGFFAELYAKINIEGEPLKVLGQKIFTYVRKLLSFKNNNSVREACNIMKLTGSNLVHMDDYKEKMDPISKELKELALDTSLNKTCTGLIMQVIELSNSNWGCAASAIPPIHQTGKQLTEKTSNFNPAAPPFVPSESFNHELYDISETVFAIQQPVTSAEEWSEFVGDDHECGGYNNSAGNLEEDEYDGLDPEIELEMEAFIDEIEEHLMLQDFDPELHQEPKSGKK